MAVGEREKEAGNFVLLAQLDDDETSKVTNKRRPGQPSHITNFFLAQEVRYIGSLEYWRNDLVVFFCFVCLGGNNWIEPPHLCLLEQIEC